MNRITTACGIYYQDRILMIQEKSNGRLIYDIPAGGVKLGESLTECILREVKEEVGIQIKSPKLIGIFEFIEKEKTTINFLYKFTFREKPNIKILKHNQEENISNAEFVSIKEIQEILESKPQVFEHKLAITRLHNLINRNLKKVSVIKVDSTI